MTFTRCCALVCAAVSLPALLAAAPVPASAGPGTFTVAIAAGTDLVQGIEPLPEVHGVEPSGGPVAGGQAVTITGRNFQNVYAVAFGMRHAQFVMNDPTSITAISPPADAPATVYIVVKTHQTYAWLPSSYTYTVAVADDHTVFADGFESGSLATWGASEAGRP